MLKRLHASSITAWGVAGVQLAVAFVLSIVSSVLLVLAATLAQDFDTAGHPAGVVGVFAVLVVGFAALGIFLGAVLPTARAAQAVGMLVWFVMLFLGGAGPPPEGADQRHAAGLRTLPAVARRADHADGLACSRSRGRLAAASES